MAYTDATTLKRYLSITSTGDDTLLGECITRAQAAIDAYCNRTFEASADTTRTFDVTEDVFNRTLFLGADLCAITSITNGDGETVANTEYITRPRHSTPYYELALKTTSDVAWTYEDDPADAITIVGRWAYSTTAPDAIVQACVRLAAWYYRQKDSNAAGDAGQARVTPEGTWIMPSAMPADVEGLLKPFRRIAT